jgi:hypothetical protein
MKTRTDHDGKSKTASGVDLKHYPEHDETENTAFEEMADLPTHEQISRRAYELWSERGYPEGSGTEDWLKAEEELRAAMNSRNAVQSTSRQSGSVQR